MGGYYGRELTVGDNGRQLVITLPSVKKVMDYQIEMIASNDINGLLSFRYLTVDGKPCFLYDVNGLVSLEEYLSEGAQGIRFFVEVLMEVSVAAGGLGKYLLEEKCLLLEPALIFIDPAKKSVKLAYLPADPPDDRQAAFCEFVLDFVRYFQPEDATGKLFCRRIIEEVKKAGFRYDSFTDFLLDILCFSNDRKNGDGDVGWTAGRVRDDAGAKAGKTTKPRAKPPDMLKNIAAADGKLLIPALSAAAVVMLYFLVGTFIPENSPSGSLYKMLALLAAVCAELFLFRYFLFGASAQRKDAPGKKERRSVKFAQAVRAASLARDAGSAESGGSVASTNLWENSVKPDTATAQMPTTNEEPQSPITSEDSAGDSQPVAVHVSTADVSRADSTVISHADLAGESQPAADDASDAMPDVTGIAVCDEPVYTAGDVTVVSTREVTFVTDQNMTVSQIQGDDDVWPEYFKFDVYADIEDQKESCPQTELLPAAKKICATLLIKNMNRAYGVALNNNEFIIGRKMDSSDLILDNPAVGKIHAKLIKIDNHWYIMDLSSKNGTYLNNIRLESGGRKELANSDLITIANVDMVFAPSMSASAL